MTELLRAAPDTDAPLAQDCLRLLAALLRACAAYQCAPSPRTAHGMLSGLHCVRVRAARAGARAAYAPPWGRAVALRGRELGTRPCFSSM
jgi:hypothetical protein